MLMAAARLCFASFSAMRALTSVLTSAASNPFFGSKRIVPGLVLYSFRSGRCALTVEPLHG